MKKLLITTIALFVLVSCQKEEDAIQAPRVDYTGLWRTQSTQCIPSSHIIEEGSNENELLFDGRKGILIENVLSVSSPFGDWLITFRSPSAASFDYNGLCSGTMRKDR